MRTIVESTDQASVIINNIEISCASNHAHLRKKLSEIVLDFKDFDISQFQKIDPFSVAYKNQMLELFKALRKDKYSPNHEGFLQTNIKERARWRMPYGQPPKVVGDFLSSFAYLIKSLNLDLGKNILELGCGEGALSEIILKMGYNITAVDICESSCQITEHTLRELETDKCRAKVICSSFDLLHFPHDSKFDAIIFFESFHHALNHDDLLGRLKLLLNPGGKIVFGAEPILFSSKKLPYPWGLRMDGESLRAIINFGWMELGFSPLYFCKLMKRHHLSWRRFCAPTSHMADIVIAQPIENVEKSGFKQNTMLQVITWNLFTLMQFFLKKIY